MYFRTYVAENSENLHIFTWFGSNIFYQYNVAVEDYNKLNVRSGPCFDTESAEETTFYSAEIYDQCMANCYDEVWNRIPCNCSVLTLQSETIHYNICHGRIDTTFAYSHPPTVQF